MVVHQGINVMKRLKTPKGLSEVVNLQIRQYTGQRKKDKRTDTDLLFFYLRLTDYPIDIFNFFFLQSTMQKTRVTRSQHKKTGLGGGGVVQGQKYVTEPRTSNLKWIKLSHILFTIQSNIVQCLDKTFLKTKFIHR